MTASADNLDGRIALVTGASRGIGRSIALELGARGAKVVGTATSESGAGLIQSTLEAAGIAGAGLRLDVREAPACAAAIEEIDRRFGSISILVNNAGVTHDNLALRMSDEDWNDVLEINLKAVFRLSKLVMRSMIKARYGRIINITSVVGATGNPGQANYAAAKAGTAGLSRSLARELGARNITVNCVAPGFIETDMTKALAGSQRDALLQQIALGRLGRPEEVAAAVAFLASPAAAYVTGATLHVNGGIYMG